MPVHIHGLTDSTAKLTGDAKHVALKPPHFDIAKVVRPNIFQLEPYRCARDDYQSGILLDANEHALGHALPPGTSTVAQAASSANGTPSSTLTSTSISTSTSTSTSSSASTAALRAPTLDEDPLALHRYPDPSLFHVKTSWAKLRGLPFTDAYDPTGGSPFVFLGVGSDEVLDLLQRVTCRPGRDKILICPPTYGMYTVCAVINDLEVVQVPLDVDSDGDKRFMLRVDEVNKAAAADPDIKLIFLCSPGNPTGSLLPLSDIRRVLDNPAYNGLVVVDEAYIDFAIAQEHLDAASQGRPVRDVSACSLVKEYQNLVVVQTLSKAFGLAAIRLGAAFAQPPIIQLLNNTKAPYNIGAPTAHLASLGLSPAGVETMRTNLQTLLSNRDWFLAQLATIPATGRVLSGKGSNFILVEVLNAPRDQGGEPSSERAGEIYKEMAEHRGLVVRFRAKELGCRGCLRVTIGTREEMEKLVELLKELLA